MLFNLKKKDNSLPNENKQNTWLEIKKNKSNYLLIAPYMIIFITFTVIPVISSMVLSFTYFNMLQWPEWRGWMNYKRLFLEDDIFLIGLKNTLMFASYWDRRATSAVSSSHGWSTNCRRRSVPL